MKCRDEVAAVLFCVALMSSISRADTVSFAAFPNNSTHSSSAVAAAIANVPSNAGTVYDALGGTDDIEIDNYGTKVYSGPVDVTSTLNRIRAGDFMPTEKDDGGFFNFRTGELPNIPRMGNNYYMEFVVWPYLNLAAKTYDTGTEAYGTMEYPGSMRLLIGLGGQVYFTGDHYGEEGPMQNAYVVSVPTPSGFVSWGTLMGGLIVGPFAPRRHRA